MRAHWASAAALVAAVTVVTAAGATPSPTFRQLLDAGIPIYCGGGDKGYVAFTFDDGPGPYTARLVALLKQYGVRATFFEIGQKAVRKPKLVRLEASVGVLYLVDSLGVPQAAFMAVVLAVFLPALTYCLLTATWLVRTLVEIARFARR